MDEIRIIRGDEEYIFFAGNKKIVTKDIKSLARCLYVAFDEEIPDFLMD